TLFPHARYEWNSSARWPHVLSCSDDTCSGVGPAMTCGTVSYAPSPTTMLSLPPPSRQFPPISPPNPPSASRDLGPTITESDPEPVPESVISILMKEKHAWMSSPKDYFASAPLCIDAYVRSFELPRLNGRIAFRLRTGEFYRCRLTWGQRGKKAFLSHLEEHMPELSKVDYRKWIQCGETTDTISQKYNSGTIVASCLSSLPDSAYRMVSRNQKNDEQPELLQELRSPLFKGLAKKFEDLERALAKYIAEQYSGLRKPVKKALISDRLQTLSFQEPYLPKSQQPLHVGSGGNQLPAEPRQDVATDSFFQEPTLYSIGQYGPVEAQQPQTMQQYSKVLTPTWAVMQLLENVAEQPSQQVLSTFFHNPESRTAYPAQPYLHSDTSPSVPGVIGSFPHQSFAKEVVTSTPPPADNIWSIDREDCSVGPYERTRTDRSQLTAVTSRGAGCGRALARAWPPMVGIPVHECWASWTDVPQQSVAQAPLGWTANQPSRDDCYRDCGFAAVSNPQTTIANNTWLRAPFGGPEIDGGTMFLTADFPSSDQTWTGSYGSVLVDNSAAVVGVETPLHQVHKEANNQGAYSPWEMGKTSMSSVAGVRQRVRC
ncbi:hypothetical protein CI238_13382, partial [Colletotrichum incanum]